MQLILRELIPRLIGVMLVIVSAIVASNILHQKSNHSWQTNLEKISVEAGEYAHTWLMEKMEALTPLIEDSRALSVFYEPESLNLARTALYEFGSVNKTDGVYLFDVSLAQVIAKRAGAPELSPDSVDFLIKAHEEGWTRISYFATSPKGETLLSFASIIRGDINEVIGYAIYTLPYRSALKNLKSPLIKKFPLKLALYRMNSNKTTDAIYYYNGYTPTYIRLTKGRTKLPVFAAQKHTGTYPDIRTREEALTHIAELPRQQHWLISASIPTSFINEKEKPSLKIIYLTAILFGLILLLIPNKKGAYSRFLARSYKKMIPTVLGAVPDEDMIDIPDIDPEEIMQNIAAKKREEGQFSQTAFKDKEKTSSRLTTTPNVAFVGKAREEGFGTQLSDIKPVQKRHVMPPKVPKPEIRKDVQEFIIRKGIKDENFKLLYQPIFDVKKEKVVMYEVLCRILDDAGEVIPPSEWLPVVRKDNLFQEIDKGVIHQATTQHILSETPLGKPLTFNLSGGTFDSLAFMESLMGKLVDRPDLASLMLFELSSKEIIQDKKALKFIRECRELGFKFSIDYFGGGVKTLEAAKKLKFDFMKIDALKFDLYVKDDQKALVQLIITANKIKLPLIIERIESRAFYNLIKKLGVPYAQGYLLGKPADIEEVE